MTRRGFCPVVTTVDDVSQGRSWKEPPRRSMRAALARSLTALCLAVFAVPAAFAQAPSPGGGGAESHAYTKGEMRENLDRMLNELDWIVRSYVDLPPSFTEEVAFARAAADEIPPEAMERLAIVAGEQTEELAARLILMRRDETRFFAEADRLAASKTPIGVPMSLGFPPAPDLPEYGSGWGAGNVSCTDQACPDLCCPYVTEGRCERNGLPAEPKCSQEPDGGPEASRPRPVQACEMFVGPDGRIERLDILEAKRAQDVVFAMDVVNAVMDSICGGLDVVVAFGCEVCCIPFRVAQAVVEAKQAYSELCEAEKDTAELEAAMHYSIANYNGLRHVHEDLEQQEGALTSYATTIRNDITSLQTLINSSSSTIQQDTAAILEISQQISTNVDVSLTILANALNDLAAIIAGIDSIDNDLAQLSAAMAAANANATAERSELNDLIKEVIRLLHVPTGQRSSEVEACGGRSCEFPEKGKSSFLASQQHGANRLPGRTELR